MSLGTRLALAIGSSVALVILVTVIAVSVGVLGRFDAYLAEVRVDRYADVSVLAAELVADRGRLDIRGQELRRLAIVAGGTLVIRDPDGTVVTSVRELPGLGRAGRTGGAAGTPVTLPIVVDGATVGSIEVTPLAGATDVAAPAPTAFREAALLLVIIAGLVAVVASMLVTLLVARRLTRPVGTLAAAARRVETGDLTVRVDLPADAESRELAVAFNDMAERLERSERLRRRASSELAHELGTPITILVGRLQALADGVIAADAGTLAATRDTAEEIARLVGDLQDLSAAEGAGLRRTAAVADLRSIAARAGASTQALFDQAGVTLDLEGAAPGDPVVVLVDERQVERAIGNLLTNAATYTPAGGTVVVSVTSEGSNSAVRIGDTGPGIDEEDLPNVFDRFYRGRSGRDRAADGPGGVGTGIGLTVARDLIGANDGTLSVERTSPAGTTFLVRLPGG